MALWSAYVRINCEMWFDTSRNTLYIVMNEMLYHSKGKMQNEWIYWHFEMTTYQKSPDGANGPNIIDDIDLRCKVPFAMINWMTKLFSFNYSIALVRTAYWNVRFSCHVYNFATDSVQKIAVPNYLIFLHARHFIVYWIMSNLR